MSEKILVTGGLGFIGSHTVVELVNNGYNILIIDNLSNSKLEVLDNIKKLCNPEKVHFIEVDVLKLDMLSKVFEQNKLHGIIHFAALKSVNESIKNPIKYYQNNIISTLNILELCKKHNVNRFLFSSSATVYGSSKSPLNEDDSIGLGITNPYGQTKYMNEKILEDVSKIGIKTINLRYFNPVGAHKSGFLGENPNGIPNNLMPFVLKVAIKNNIKNNNLDDTYNELSIYGNDYETEDGTCKRDFIHVVDLANAHVLAYNYICNMSEETNVFNIGTGKATSVLEIIDAFIKYNNVILPYKILQRREGDISVVYCNSSKAKKILNWEAKHSLQEIVEDTWKYYTKI
jgi:UDP-glucose 4-epimerase